MASRTCLILGGYGLTGERIARLLLQQSDVRVLLAGRDASKAERAALRLNDQFPGGRAEGCRADASDERGLQTAFEGADLVVVASPTATQVGVIARAAIDTGIDYLDLQFSREKLRVLRSLASEIERAGRCFITEAGLHPGLPAAIVRFLASRFDQVETAYVAALMNPGPALPWAASFDELVEGFRDFEAAVFKEGRWRAAPLWGMKDMKRFDFGPPFGVRSCAPMLMEEMRSLPTELPGLRETGLYMAGTNWFADYLVTPAILAGLFLAPKRAIRPAGRLLHWSWSRLGSPPYGFVVKGEAVGVSGGSGAEVAVTISHEDGYLLTAIPVVACLLQYLDGAIRRPGLWLMGLAVDPERLLQDMKRMGVQVRIEEKRGAPEMRPAG